MNNTVKLNPISVKVMNKLSLTREDIFLDSVRQLEGKSITNQETGEVTTLDSVIYINVRGYVEDGATLSISIFPESNKVAFFVGKDTGEVDAKGKKVFDNRQVQSPEFRELLASRTDSVSQDIDSI